MSLLSAFAQGFVNRVLQRSTAQGVVHLLNVRTNCGDNGGSNPVSDCLFWDTLRFLVEQTVRFAVVNVLEISQNIRFKAIFSLSVAFSILSWVAIPLKHIKRLESLKISLEKVYCLTTDSEILGEIYRIFETVIQRFYIIHAGSMAQYNSWFLI